MGSRDLDEMAAQSDAAPPVPPERDLRVQITVTVGPPAEAGDALVDDGWSFNTEVHRKATPEELMNASRKAGQTFIAELDGAVMRREEARRAQLQDDLVKIVVKRHPNAHNVPLIVADVLNNAAALTALLNYAREREGGA